MASKKVKGRIYRYVGKPTILSPVDPIFEWMWIRQAAVNGEPPTPPLPAFKVYAHDCNNYWEGWRDGVDQKSHPKVAWFKKTFERVDGPDKP